MEEKTNVMRLLDSKHIRYNSYTYKNAISGMEVADYLHEPYDKVFKTLVTIGHSKKYYVFDIPVNKELNLKKAAISVNEKSIEMIKSASLLTITGYIHGGCSPIGMKKQFKTVFDSTALNQDTVFLSGGKIGYQVEISLEELNKIIQYTTFDLTI